MDEDGREGWSKSLAEAFTQAQYDSIDELSQLSVLENARQGKPEELAAVKNIPRTLGPEPLVETVSTPPTTIVLSSGAASSTEQTLEKMVKPGKYVTRLTILSHSVENLVSPNQTASSPGMGDWLCESREICGINRNKGTRPFFLHWRRHRTLTTGKET